MEIVEFDSVKRWASDVAPLTAKVGTHVLIRFFAHLNSIDKYRGMNPDQVRDYQKEQNKTRDNEYEILDVLKDWVQSKDLRFNTKHSMYSIVRSFFEKNRARLPNERFKIKTNKPTTQGEFPLNELKKLILRLDPCEQAVFLCMFQGGLDEEGLIYWSNNGLENLREQLRSYPDVVKIDLPGRKASKNIINYYTFVGTDAIDALKNWLRKRPDGTNAIFVNRHGTPVTKSGLYTLWLRNMRSLSLIPPTKKGDRGYRTGKSIHELRDCFRTQWAKSDTKKEIAEFLMGHKIDPRGYNKSYLDTDFYKAEYLKALPYLNIMSSGTAFHQVPEERLRTLQEKYDEQQKQIKEMLLQMETLKAVAEREIDRQTPRVDAAIEEIQKNPGEMKNLQKGLDFVFGKDGEAREKVNEIVKTLMKHGVKKGKKIIMNTDSSPDHPTLPQET